MEIIKCLSNASIVSGFKILEYKTFPNGFYIKISAFLKDQSELHIREYSDNIERNYSYHWQDKNSNLIIRWDNAPHHPKLFNSPHHKHTDIGDIEPSNEVILEDVLKVISKILK